jgi:glycosyltransferase involved in cell wall biosynthesis
MELKPVILPKVSVIVPVYFNVDSLPSLFLELELLEFNCKEVQFEFIFVDDGSKDNSDLIILTFRAKKNNVIFVKLSRNFGAINASTTGLKYATGDCVIFLAADLQDPPELISKMIAAWRNGYKFVICERESRKDSFRVKIFANFYYTMLRKFVLSDFPKGGFDLALMDKVMVPVLLESSKTSYIPILAWWQGFSPYVIKYHRLKREHGKSKWTLAKRINAMIDIFLGFSIAPIRTFFYVGSVVSIASLGYGAWIITQAAIGKVPVQGFATLTVLLSFFSGIIISGISVIGEYLWRVLDQVNSRPRAIVEQVYPCNLEESDNRSIS